jgi:tripartite-type tricarboxylate transporter receptor subunit TctC
MTAHPIDATATRRAVLAAALVGLAAPAVRAQGAWPNRPIRFVVAYPAGGSVDIATRLIAEKLSQVWGQPVIVENRGGASGTIGADSVAKSRPDGSLFLMGASPELAIVGNTMANIPFDVQRDFAPIILVNEAPFILVAHPAVQARTAADLVALAQAQPGRLNFASSGNGTSSHLTGELFNQVAGVQITHVPYRGSGALMSDLVGGQVQLTFDTIPTTLPHVREGRLVAIAAAMRERSPQMPDLPTFAEAGLPGVVGGSWSGLLAPAGTDAAVVERIRADIAKLLDGAVGATLRERGFVPRGLGPAEFRSFIAAETTKWRGVAERAGVRPT